MRIGRPTSPCTMARRETRPADGQRRSAFTLVELLVVLAVIALLASLLVPALGRAKDLTRRAVCSAHLRGLVQANQTYAASHGRRLVVAAPDVFSDNLHRWHGQRESSDDPFDPARGPLAPYLGSAGLGDGCPAFADVLDDGDGAGSFEAGCGGYGYNNQYVGGRNDLYGFQGYKHSATTSEIANPTQTVMFTDTAYRQMGNAYVEYSFCESPFWHFSAGATPSTSSPNPTIHFRHLGAANAAWADGHVETRPLEFSADYMTHSLISADQAAHLQLGWFGPRDNSLFDLK